MSRPNRDLCFGRNESPPAPGKGTGGDVRNGLAEQPKKLGEEGDDLTQTGVWLTGRLTGEAAQQLTEYPTGWVRCDVQYDLV